MAVKKFLSQSNPSFLDSSWLSVPEGQLSIDVHETPSHILVRSAIAGVKTADLQITLMGDTLTIRGTRHHEQKTQRHERTHIQECHWGAFSRSVILPSHVSPSSVQATLKRGILTIVMKKTEMEKNVSVIDLGDI